MAYVGKIKLSREEVASINEKSFPGYVWGPVKRVHKIGGRYEIVEAAAQVFKRNTGTDVYDFDKSHFSVFVDGEDTCFGAQSLDVALLIAIAAARNAGNQAHVFAAKLLNVPIP